jgi:hypothetical protein
MVCGAILLRIPKTRRNTTTTKHAQINTITYKSMRIAPLFLTADGCFYFAYSTDNAYKLSSATM